MNFNIILADDDLDFVTGCRAFINESIPGFKVVDYVIHPAPGEGQKIADGPLVKMLESKLKDDFYTSDNPLFLLLDINFGSRRPGDDRLGIKVVRYVYSDSLLKDRVHIIILTGTMAQRPWKELASLGVKQFIPKADYRYDIGTCLAVAAKGELFLNGLNERSQQEFLKLHQYYEYVKRSAQGYTNRSHPIEGARSSIGNARSKWKELFIHELIGKQLPSGLKTPNEDEWDIGVWLLLHLLHHREYAIIEYVEQITGLQIVDPVKPGEDQNGERTSGISQSHNLMKDQ